MYNVFFLFFIFYSRSKKRALSSFLRALRRAAYAMLTQNANNCQLIRIIPSTTESAFKNSIHHHFKQNFTIYWSIDLFFAMHISDFLGDFQSLSCHCLSLTPISWFHTVWKRFACLWFHVASLFWIISWSHDLIVSTKLPLPSFYRMVLPILVSCRSRLLSCFIFMTLPKYHWKLAL